MLSYRLSSHTVIVYELKFNIGTYHRLLGTLILILYVARSLYLASWCFFGLGTILLALTLLKSRSWLLQTAYGLQTITLVVWNYSCPSLWQCGPMPFSKVHSAWQRPQSNTDTGLSVISPCNNITIGCLAGSHKDYQLVCPGQGVNPDVAF